MKNILSLTAISLLFFLQSTAQTTHTVEASGFDFTPATLDINAGDIVEFSVGSTHPVLEVTESTWNADGSTAKAGGFAFPSGEGQVTLNDEGTYYYICTNHINFGMKGTINVTGVISSTKELQNQSLRVNVFPNPVQNSLLRFTIHNSKAKDYQLVLFDLTGKKVLEEYLPAIEPNSSGSISLKRLESGIYFLTTISDEQEYTIRIVL